MRHLPFFGMYGRNLLAIDDLSQNGSSHRATLFAGCNSARGSSDALHAHPLAASTIARTKVDTSPTGSVAFAIRPTIAEPLMAPAAPFAIAART